MVEQMQKNNLFFRQLLFLVLLLTIAVVLFRQLSFFIGAFLGAITLYIVFRGTFFRLVDRYRWRPWLASLTIVLAAAVILVGLLMGVFEIISREIQTFQPTHLLGKFDAFLKRINEMLNMKLIPENLLGDSPSILSKLATAIIHTTYSFAINIALTLLVLYFMLANARKLESKVNRYNPLRGESRRMINEEITGIIYSNAVGIPVMMLAQGLVAAFIYWLFGIHNVVFWAFLTALCGLIPMVGTAIVSVPLGIAFALDGEVLKGIMLILCGVLIIANVDNLARIMLNKKIANTHPLTVIFGVILGIPLFGFWGIIFGPLLIAVFLLLIRIYYTEFNIIPKAELNEDKLEDDIRIV